MQTALSPHEVAERGRALYLQQLKDKVELEHKGEFLMLDIVSGDYEVDADDIAAEERLVGRHANAVIYQVRIGSAAAYFMGGSTT